MYPWEWKAGDKVIYDYYGDTSVRTIKSIEVNESETDQWGIPYHYAVLDSGEKVCVSFLKKSESD